MTALYTASVTVNGGREGHAHSSDNMLNVDLRMPKEMGGPGGNGTNPEQLFAAGYAACFESALRLVTRAQKKPAQDTSLTALVTLHSSDEKKYTLSVELHGKIHGLTKEETLTLMQEAHQICPYSVAIHGNVKVKLIAE